MTEPPRPSLAQLAMAFANVGLTGVGGAAGPLRHVIVKQRKWLAEGELAELFGLGQALPGANVVNVAVMFGDRARGPLGALAAVAGLCIPSLLVALVLATLATQLSASNARFAAAESAVTAAVAGIFVSNGVRVVTALWSDGALDVRLVLRLARVAITALGIVLVAAVHLRVPIAVVVLVAASLAVEWCVERRRSQ